MQREALDNMVSASRSADIEAQRFSGPSLPARPNNRSGSTIDSATTDLYIAEVSDVNSSDLNAPIVTLVRVQLPSKSDYATTSKTPDGGHRYPDRGISPC
jgi:hypothetical protein